MGSGMSWLAMERTSIMDPAKEAYAENIEDAVVVVVISLRLLREFSIWCVEMNL